MDFRNQRQIVSTLNNISKESILSAIKQVRRKDILSHYNSLIINTLIYQLIEMATKFGSFDGVKEDIIDVLTVDCFSMFIEVYELPIEYLMGMCLALTIRFRDGCDNASSILKKIINKKSLSYKMKDITKHSMKFYSNVWFSCKQSNGASLEDNDFQNFQLNIDTAVDPNQNSQKAIITEIFWATGIFYEMKNLICHSSKINPDFLYVIESCYPCFTKTFSKIFTDSINEEIQLIEIKARDFKFKAFPLFRFLKILDNSNSVIDKYFNIINDSLNSNNFTEGIDEINYIITQPLISDYEKQKLLETYDFLLTNYKKDHSKIINSLTSFLSDNKLIDVHNLFDKVKTQISLYMPLLSYIQPAFEPTIIDETYQNNTFSSDMAEFIIFLLESGEYKSTQLDSIFLDLIKLDTTDYFKKINKFAKQEAYKAPILTAIRNYVSVNDIKTHILEICTILNNFELSEQNDQQILEKISTSILYNLDSIEILPLFNYFKFLVINDLSLFIDLSPHNSLFYTVLIDKNLPQSNELVDELISFDENENEKACDCNAFHEFLIKAYNDTHDPKFLFKLLENTEFNSNDNDDDYSNDETYQSLSILCDFLQNTESKEKLNHIISFLQKDKLTNNKNFNLKNLLISVSDLKEHFQFSDASEIDSLVSSLTLNDDSLAFIASIGGKVSEEQLNSLFTSSDNFYPKFIVASMFPSTLDKISNEEKMKCYKFGCQIKHFRLCNSIIKSVSSLLVQEKSIFDDCIINTSSKIAALTLSNIQDSTPGIFNDKEQINNILSGLYNSQTQDNFDLPFSAYLNRIKKNDSDLCIAIWEIYFGNQFPPFYRTDNNNYELFKLISTSTSTFASLIEQATIQPYSLYRPSVSSIFVQMFSNVPSLYSKVEQLNYKLNFYRILFGYQDQINGVFQDKTVLDFIKTLKISDNAFESVLFTFSDQQLSSDTLDPVHGIVPKDSVSSSLFNARDLYTIAKAPSVLIIRHDEKAGADFVIDEQLDLSKYSVNTAYYELRSVGCENEVAFLRQKEHNRYLKCTTKEVTVTDKIDSINDVNYIVYEKVSNFNENALNKKLHQFWTAESMNVKQTFDANKVLLRCLQSESIDWSLFEQNDDFLNVAIKLIQLGVKKVFTILSSSHKLSSIFFEKYLDLIDDEAFTTKYRDEILNLADVYDSDPAFLFLNLTEHLNSKNIRLFFELFNKFDIMKDTIDNRVGVIEYIDDSLIDTPEFEKFYIDTINMPDCNDELINYLINIHKKLIPLMFKASSTKYFHVYSNLIDKDQFVSIVNGFQPDFIIYALEHCNEKRSEFLPIALKKLKDTPEWKDYMNRTANDLSINDIQSIYETEEIDMATKILKSKYPPEKLTKQDEVKNMFINILSKSRSSNLYLSMRPIIQEYKSIFIGDPRITELMASFVFTLRGKDIQENINDFTDLIKVLPQLSWNKILELYSKLFPLKNGKSSFTNLNAESMFLFMIVLACRSIQSYEGFVYTNIQTKDFISDIFIVACKFIGNKKEFVNLILPTFTKFLNNPQVFLRYLTDLESMPYIIYKLIESTNNTEYWKTEYSFYFVSIILKSIRMVYGDENLFDVCFYLDDENSNTDDQSSISPADRCTISLLRLASTNLKEIFLKANSQNYNFADKPSSKIMLNDLDGIHIEKLSDNVKLEFFNFFNTAAFIHPLFMDKVVHYITETKRNVSMYQRITNDQIKDVYTNLICRMFNEIAGDRKQPKYANDIRFNKAAVLLKSQLMRLLLTKNFTFAQFKPYYQIFMDILKMKSTNPDFKACFARNLKNYPFVLYLLYTKQIKDEKVDNTTKINMFLLNFFNSVGPTDNPYPRIVIDFINSLKADDPQLKEILNILNYILESSYMKNYKNVIVQYCFNEFEAIALKRPDIPRAQEILDSFILLLGNIN